MANTDILTAAVDAYVAALKPAEFTDLVARTRDPEEGTTSGTEPRPGVDRLAQALNNSK